MVKSDITCMQNASGFVSWQGELAPCLADNAQFSWSTGESNRHNEPPMTGISNLTPGTYCVSITPFNNQGQNCDCHGYFCTEIGSWEALPLAIEADIRPVIVCDFIEPWVSDKIIEEGSIYIYTTGGFGTTNLTWTHNVSGGNQIMVPPDGKVASHYKYCATATDQCDNEVFKCFEIPIVYERCTIHEKGDPKIIGDDVSNRSDNNEDYSSQVNNLKQIKVFPNPVSDLLNIQFYASLELSISTTLFASDGKRVLKEAVQTQIGSNEFAINVSDLLPGIYYLDIGNTYSQKIIITH